MSQESTEDILKFVLEAQALAYPEPATLPPIPLEEAAKAMYAALLSCEWDWGVRGFDEYEFQKYDTHLINKALAAYRRTPEYREAQ